jgi:hypothetical protein
MRILGINSVYHESSTALIVNGRLWRQPKGNGLTGASTERKLESTTPTSFPGLRSGTA